MKERLIARLFTLQSKLNDMNSYNYENSNALFKYSIEFEILLGILLRMSYTNFNAVANKYAEQAQRYCELGCELCDEKNREIAFSAGKSELMIYVEECIDIIPN